MILSASRRTDIPAFYHEWLLGRLAEGKVLVRNPVNPRQVGQISLAPDVLDGIVFWTKNPAPMLPSLQKLASFPYYFQFTLTGYGEEIETNLPPLAKLCESFRALCASIGPRRIIWRYDPILIGPQLPAQAHLARFSHLARLLRGCTEKCVISFLEPYAKIQRRLEAKGLRAPTADERASIASGLVALAREENLRLESCACGLASFGIPTGKCVDATLLGQIGGLSLAAGKAKGQRPACRCDESVDIGAYNTCQNGCVYCYANHSAGSIAAATATFHPASLLLCGSVSTQDHIVPRHCTSLFAGQLGLGEDVPAGG